MTNEYYDQYYRNHTEGGETAPRERADYAQPRAAVPQSGCRQSVYRAPHYVNPAAGQTTANPYGASSPNGQKPEKKKKGKKSTGAVAAVMAVCIMLSGAAGFGGSFLYSQMNASSSDTAGDQLVVNKVSKDDVSTASVNLTEKSTNQIVSEVADSVVEITTEIVQTDSFYGQYVAQGAGSGVIITDDGYILTNNHVIDGASSINVTLRSGESYEAKLVGTDADMDVALVKIEASGLTAATLGDSSDVSVGDKSVIIGNPLGTLGGSVTEGIISAVDRSIEIDGKTMHLMQTDAAVNPGNSGGGMFNGQGELVGIVVAKSTGTSSGDSVDNIGFVIPINNALEILSDLKEFGYVRGKASTGMSFTESSGNQMFSQYYYGISETGVYVASVKSGSNAAAAGFSAGDRVISVDGSEVSSVSDLKEIISGHSVGDTVTFEIERSGRTGALELTLEEYVPTGSV